MWFRDITSVDYLANEVLMLFIVSVLLFETSFALFRGVATLKVSGLYFDLADG